MERMGSQIKQSHDLLRKVHAVMKQQKMSIFELFCSFDVNLNCRLSKLELKTGIQALGIAVQDREIDILWKAKDKASSAAEVRNVAAAVGMHAEQGLSYAQFLGSFAAAGVFKYERALENTANLMEKFKAQFKRLKLNADKLYAHYDPSGYA